MNTSLLKCGVVDDSSMQRLAIVNLIKKHPQLELVGEWNNAINAHNGLLKTKTDVLFLDIEMPIVNGFRLLDELNTESHVVIVTGKSKYAHRAFDYNAIDFLKKPLRPNRFSATIKKITTAQMAKTIIDYKNTQPSIFVRSGIKRYKIFLNDILYISAMGDFAKIHLKDNETLLITGTMGYLESLLPRKDFLRIHRSFIVSLEKIENFTSRHLEINQIKIPISRQKTTTLKTVLNER